MPGEINLYELIYSIKKINKKIRIMIILEREEKEIINFLWSQQIYDIFYNNKTLIKEIIQKINDKEKTSNSKKIFNKRIIKKKLIKLKINYYKKTRKFENKNLLNRIIFVEGSSGVGKSIFISIMIKLIRCKNVIVYDLKNDVKLIINKKEITYLNGEITYDDILKNKNLNNIILIEDNNNMKKDFKKELLNKSDNILILIEPNLLGIKKTKEILEENINEFNILKEKIKIIFNKTTPYSIADLILNQLFKDFKIIGKIKFNCKYDLAINCNLQYLDKEIKKENLKIIKNLKVNKKNESL